MKQVVRGRTTTELNNNVSIREKNGWKRITENKLDDSMISYGDISWVCVMVLENGVPDKKRKWGHR